jgi:glycosyltransferase involved in cell wall biosynthesis
MRFLLVYPAFGVLGGIETLIARMSRWLVENGHEVTVLTESKQNLGDLLPERVRCIALGGRFRELSYYFRARKLWKTLEIGAPDVIKSFDVRSSWIACQLAALQGNGCKVMAGIYDPNVFKVWYAPDSRAFWKVDSLHLKNFLENIPPSARLFCWKDDMEHFEGAYHQRGVVWPLPLDSKQFLPALRQPKWGKIVSVGRLSSMKEYNLYMIDVVRDLIKKGYQVSWSVYGEGVYEPKMRERIKQEGLEGAIELKGLLPYEQFWQAIQDAYIFVGMGTAILEASFFGVPNVFATPFDSGGLTYGPVYRLPLGSTVPSKGSLPTLKVVDEIERILCLGPSEYLSEQELVRNHVQGHEMDASMRQFLKLVQDAEPFVRRPLLYLASYPLYLFRHLNRA